MWKGLKEFATYTNRQRRGIYALLVLILLFWGVLLVDDYLHITRSTDFTKFEKALARWEKEDSLIRFQRHHFTPFVFDPNEANDSIWKALGLSNRQAQTILNYRHKGGQFYGFSDLEKMYSLDSAWLEKVRPFARFPEKTSRYLKEKYERWKLRTFDPNLVSVSTLEGMGFYDWQAKGIITYREKIKPYKRPEQLYKVYTLDSSLVEKLMPYVQIDTMRIESNPGKESITVMVEINSADSLQLLEVRGIGPAFAHRIIKYRERLGGYFSKKQLLEVYGIDNERYNQIQKQITVDSSGLRKMSLNKGEFREMLKHPYLQYEMVKAIFSFREKVRPFQSISEIKELQGFTEENTTKLFFYLTL